MEYLGRSLDVVENLALKSFYTCDNFWSDNVVGLLDLAHNIDNEANEPLILIAEPVVQVHDETASS